MAEDKNWVPGPYHKIKDRHLYGMVGMNDRNFSFGERMDLSKPANENPEAIYQIPGFCDKFGNLRRKKEKTIRSQRWSIALLFASLFRPLHPASIASLLVQ